uniref:Uncharacterized protein n=1 Tax=Arundo donax TaxID=35708 RepID=A0A0A9A9E3_ARUDO
MLQVNLVKGIIIFQKNIKHTYYKKVNKGWFGTWVNSLLDSMN